ncbi:MAG: galactokinase, partial [Chloroflexi bacterium]|nr:galactokinase [Chloroflexota bacterium]
MNIPERLLPAFRKYYGAGSDPALVIRAPGRVNLIGEHTDYNDGYVLPAAIDRAVYIAASRCVSPLASLTALDLGEGTSFRVTEVAKKVDAVGRPLKDWVRYPAGVAWALQERGLSVGGVDAVFSSTVPVGAGLSSSAAVEVAFAVLWRALGAWELDTMTLARTCQRAEVEYVGVNSGLMDQFASAHGRAGHALFFDCRTFEWQPVLLPPGVAIVVADTKVRRQLGRSKYNERVAECAESVRRLSEHLPGIRALRDVSSADFAKYARYLPDVVRRRAQHIVEECARVLKSVEWLRVGDTASFGAAMNDSHTSLRDLYEVSCPELNAMVEAAQSLDGCYGARLTGAGFGGCA